MPFHAPVLICWTQRFDEPTCSTGKAVNISRYGMLVESSDEIPAYTQVVVLVKDRAFCGDATVVHCRPNGKYFRFGLQFCRALSIHVPAIRTRTTELSLHSQSPTIIAAVKHALKRQIGKAFSCTPQQHQIDSASS